MTALCPICGTDADAHPDNDCLDAWVAQDVLGRTLRKDESGAWMEFPPDYSHADWPAVAQYSRDGEALQTVLTTLLLGRAARVRTISITVRAGSGQAFHPHVWTVRMQPVAAESWASAQATTMPLAICRAAVKAAVPSEDARAA